MAARAVPPAVLELLRRTPPWGLDLVLAACFVVAGLTTTVDPDPEYEPRDGLAVALVLAATLPYCGRRAAPLAVLTTSVSAVAALLGLGYDAGALPFVLGVGAYTVGAHRPPREIAVAAVLLNATFLGLFVADSPGFGGTELAISVPAFGTALLLGWTMQSRRLRLDALEREQGQAALRAAADERLRIAQELHDVVGHSLGVIAVQAGVGMHVIDTDPAEARRALEHISTTSRSSLAEIRRLLGLMRSGEPTATHSPTPGLADLATLADEVTGAGLPVQLDVACAADLPPGVELAAYRIVQEALTNALRHAQAARATVHVALRDGALRVSVCDDGTGGTGGARAGGNGHGLIGMRERIAVYGGSLEVGPVDGGGFAVDATIPYDDRAAR